MGLMGTEGGVHRPGNDRLLTALSRALFDGRARVRKVGAFPNADNGFNVHWAVTSAQVG